jgi:predicted DCC family thiol-disulfide oxidoreductase YuxK
MSDKLGKQPVHGWVLYDASCSFCLDLLARTRSTLESGGFQPEPLQSPWVRERLDLPEDRLLEEMRVLTVEGRVLGGADALVYLATELDRRPWWGWLLVAAGKMPFGMGLLRAGYRWIAARRHCRQGACTIDRPRIVNKEETQ